MSRLARNQTERELQELIAIAAEAVEVFGDDELEQYADEQRRRVMDEVIGEPDCPCLGDPANCRRPEGECPCAYEAEQRAAKEKANKAFG